MVRGKWDSIPEYKTLEAKQKVEEELRKTNFNHVSSSLQERYNSEESVLKTITGTYVERGKINENSSKISKVTKEKYEKRNLLAKKAYESSQTFNEHTQTTQPSV